MSSNQIATVINVSVEAESTLYEDVQYVQVPVPNAPISLLCDLLDPMAERTHRVEVRQGRPLLHCASGSTSQRPAGRPRLGRAVPAIILPNNGFREPVRYEFQPLGKNTAHVVNSQTGAIPDVYKKEVGLMAAKR